MAERHIVAIGGGGLVDEPLLAGFIFGLAGRDVPAVCYLPTASGDSDYSIARFHAAFPPERARATHLPLFDRDGADLRARLLGQDVIYVGGGNTVNMLAIWRAHGIDAILREAWQAGVILCGVSAGSLCWFEAGVTDSYGPLRPLPDGLGLLAGSHCPHYDGEADRRPVYLQAVAAGLPAGIAVDDGCAVHYAGAEVAEVVCARPGARAYRVEPEPGGARETAMPARYLGR